MDDFSLIADWDGILKLMGKIFVDGFAALKDWSSIFEAFDLFEDETSSIYLVLFRAVDGYDTFSYIMLRFFVR